MGTFLVNIIGCFIIGLFFGLLERAHVMTPGENVLLITGFCGGFTTFSTFVNENYASMTGGRFLEMALYASGSFFAGLMMVWLGHRCIEP